MSMYLGQIHVRASLPVNYGLLYWASISGLHVINKWKMCSVRKIVCTMYGTGHKRIGPCNDFQNIVFVVLTTHLFNQQTKYTTDCTLKTASATRAGGATEAVSRLEE